MSLHGASARRRRIRPARTCRKKRRCTHRALPLSSPAHGVFRMAGDHGSSTKAILYAFVANFGIAITKTAAAVYTHSGSMAAEAIHSYADTANQALLFLGLRLSEKRPT